MRKLMKHRYLSTILLCISTAALADSEGFALGLSSAGLSRNAQNVTQARDGMMHNNNTRDLDLEALVSQPQTDAATHGVTNPVRLQPKQPWTAEQRDQYQRLTQGQSVYAAACTEELKQTLAAQGIYLNCQPASAGQIGYCQGDECTGD